MDGRNRHEWRALLGLLILRRDHRNSERAHIDLVGWWHGVFEHRYGWIVTNSGNLPVHVWIETTRTAEEEPVFVYSASSGSDAPAYPAEGWTVGPGDLVQFRGGYSSTDLEGSRSLIRRAVVRDNSGRQWEQAGVTGWKELPKRRHKGSVPQSSPNSG